MTLISCAFMRLDTDKPKKDALVGALVCTDPTASGHFCLVNWQNDICPCKDELISYCECGKKVI